MVAMAGALPFFLEATVAQVSSGGGGLGVAVDAVAIFLTALTVADC